MVGKKVHSKLFFTGLPRPARTARGLGLGGTSSVALPGGAGWLMSAILQWADQGGPPAAVAVESEGCVETNWCPKSSCCPSWCRVGPGNETSVVMFESQDGVHWRYLSTIADAADYPQSHEGVNEHDFTFLADGRTLMAVLRLDGGDGCASRDGATDQHYLNYHRSTSTDLGRSWSTLTPIPAGCARPRLLALGSTLVLTGGRHRNANTSDVSLWLSADGRGDSWQEYSLSYHHNTGVRAAKLPLPTYDSGVNQSHGPWTAPRQTNGYTSATQIAHDKIMVVYDQHKACEQGIGGGVATSAAALPAARGRGKYCTASFSMVVTLGTPG